MHTEHNNQNWYSANISGLYSTCERNLKILHSKYSLIHSKAMMVIEIGLGKWHFDTFEKEIPPAVCLSITPFYM